MRSASLVLTALLAGYASWLAAGIFWAFFTPTSDYQVVTTGSTVNQTQDAPVDLTRIQRLHLFGEVGAQATSRVQQTEAPETTLNIRLVGVTASTNPRRSAAIIQQGSNQNTYVPGETIASSRAVIEEILSDRVLLSNNNRIETLWLEGRDGSEVSLNISQAPQASRQREEPSEDVAEPEVELTARQQEILELISITPQPGGDGIVGYRIAPRGDEALFRELGLRPGDLAVSMNGYDLTDMAQAMQLMNELQGLSQAQVRVLRDGEYVDIEIYIPTE